MSGDTAPGAGPAEHTCLRISKVCSWLVLICLTASAGIPQTAALSTVYLTHLSSAAVKVSISLHISSREAFLSWPALAASPVFWTPSRNRMNSATHGGGFAGQGVLGTSIPVLCANVTSAEAETTDRASAEAIGLNFRSSFIKDDPTYTSARRSIQ
jgi:hypothetical protein